MPFFQTPVETNNEKVTGSHGMWSLYKGLMEKNPELSKTVSHNLNIEQEVDNYLYEPLLEPHISVLDYWKSEVRFKRLKYLVPKYLCIPPSSVPSERLFSSSGLVCDKKRNRLNPIKVQMLTFLNKNL